MHPKSLSVLILNVRNVTAHLIHVAFTIGFWDLNPSLMLTFLLCTFVTELSPKHLHLFIFLYKNINI